MGIIDLGHEATEKRKRRERHEANRAKKRNRTKAEFIQVATTTIGMHIQYMQWVVNTNLDVEHLQFIGDGCNYQLQCFARAYGWDVEDENKLPVSINVSMETDKEQGMVLMDYVIGGLLGPEVNAELTKHNPDLQPLPEDDD
jgi:hypothetical protein